MPSRVYCSRFPIRSLVVRIRRLCRPLALTGHSRDRTCRHGRCGRDGISSSPKTLTPCARLTGRGSDRSHFVIREVHVSFRTGDWDFLIGINKVFLGVAETRHLVNIVNRLDIVEDTDEEGIFWLSMVAVGLEKDWGRLDFRLPGFQERDFPDWRGRLRAPQSVDENGAILESENGKAFIDVATRYSQDFGDWDFGFSGFPRSQPGSAIAIERRRVSPGTELRPHHSGGSRPAIHIGLGSGSSRASSTGHGGSFGAMVGGFEYTIFQIADTTSGY